MSKYFLVHRGSGTFILSEECEVVQVDDEDEPESVEEIDSLAQETSTLDQLVSGALEDGRFGGPGE